MTTEQQGLDKKVIYIGSGIVVTVGMIIIKVVAMGINALAIAVFGG
jgi:hypothetical protein